MLTARLNNDDIATLLTGGQLTANFGDLPVTIEYAPNVILPTTSKDTPRTWAEDPNVNGDLYPLVVTGWLKAGQKLISRLSGNAVTVNANGTISFENATFLSPSPAAQFVRGVDSANGWAEFVNPDTGVSLHAMRMASDLYVNVNAGTGRDARYRVREGWERDML
jgi:hypothetical protein